MTFHRPAPRVKQMDGYTPKPKTVVLRRDPPATMCVPLPKFDYVRSPALLKACRELACQHCGTQDGSVVAAHSNQAIHGKGRAVKASDVYVASLCARCHRAIDESKNGSREHRQSEWTAAWIATVAALVARGLWPKDVPIPATTEQTA